MKLYTKRGDGGMTDLYGGGRIAKDTPRIDAIGEVDELNSHLGVVISGGGDAAILSPLIEIQSRLFDLGADLATPTSDGAAGQAKTTQRITESHVEQLEQWIDSATAEVKPMQHFVLPGGTTCAAQLHVARAVCRRAERVCVVLAHQAELSPVAVTYLNRLSDFLFALARQANALAGVQDVPWLGDKGE